MSTTQGTPEILTPENVRQTPPRQPGRVTPEANAESLNKIDQAEKAIADFQRRERREETSEVEVANVRATVDPLIKNGVREETVKAKEVRENIEKPQFGGQITPDLMPDAQDVTKAVQVFARAAQEELIIPPTHEPTLRVYNALKDKLSEGVPGIRTASYLQPLINGVINEPEYIKFSGEGEEPTKFEQDLADMMKSQAVEFFLHDLFTRVYAEHADAIPNITLNDIREKFNAVKQQNLLRTQTGGQTESSSMKRQEESYLLDELEDIENPEESNKTKEMYFALESPTKFFEYYKTKYTERLTQLEASIPDPDRRSERAAKDVTEEIQKRLQYMMYKIYSPVLSQDPRKSFQEAVSELGRGFYGVDPKRLYNWLKKRILNIKTNLERTSENFEQQARDLRMPFYQFGNEEKEVFVQVTDPNDKSKKRSRLVKETVVSSELKKTNFSDFVENLHIALDAEDSLLQGAINFNHLMLTGKLDQGQSTFFTQAAHYAEAFVPSARLDELYKLPYHEIVESAKIALSSYYKKEFAKIGWKRDPELLQGIFESLDRVQKELLEDMVHNFKHREPPVPDWAVKRALIHARLHLSLVNLEMHALASYAHAPISELGSPTYRDPALKNLEVFKTWYAHEQWRVSDTSLKGMAFMPAVSAGRQYKDWFHEDVTAEGEEIYKESLLMGRLARLGRKYFDWDVAPNIMELNPMHFGGIEIQRGWRLKYPAMPWLTDLLDHLNNEETLKLTKDSTITEGWKRLENIGINVLKMYRDTFMFGPENEFIKYKNLARNEEKIKNFYGYLYRRFFSNGVGKQALSITINGNSSDEKTIKLSEINSEQQFWEEVVRPILFKPVQMGEGESKGNAEKRNLSERTDSLKQIVNHALTVMAFERMPMDFVFVEDPSRSQNGVTLMGELQRQFITEAPAGLNAKEQEEYKEKKIKELDHAFNDLVYVQQYAREISVKQMNDFVKHQNDNGETVRNVFSKNTGDLINADRSDIDLTDGHGPKGYVINREVVQHVLEHQFPNDNARVQKALEVYDAVLNRIVDKPGTSHYENNPEALATETRLKVMMKERGLDYNDSALQNEFERRYVEELRQQLKEARDNNMQTRLEWSGNELLSDETVFAINDTAYQFLEFVRSGEGMVQRSVAAIANTQEKYKSWMTNVDGALLSALKKYYRKEDSEELHHGIVEMRNKIKEEDGDEADRMAFECLMNSINVMRINSDAENKVVELAYQASHRRRSAFSSVVNEGEEYPLRRDQRYTIVEEFLHSAQFPKRAKVGDQVYEYQKPNWTFKDFLGNLGDIGEQIGQAADSFFGRDAGKLVRKKFKEESGEGMRSRELATMYDIFIKYGGKTYFAFIAMALLMVLMSKGYEESE